MSDEIKEILELIGNSYYYGNIAEEQKEKYCNYITNLQQENDRLNNIINKAIEYIDKCKTLSITDKKIILSINLLENILKGE